MPNFPLFGQFSVDFHFSIFQQATLFDFILIFFDPMLFRSDVISIFRFYFDFLVTPSWQSTSQAIFSILFCFSATFASINITLSYKGFVDVSLI